ncbi:MAG: branched-chain amino acid ABC transporter substrate-binding protein [Gemmatimonadota bacterium]|nr:branched-chain amino acid ABC transporter substrate-binding protein [Gemmatimonadota bacterium]
MSRGQTVLIRTSRAAGAFALAVTAVAACADNGDGRLSIGIATSDSLYIGVAAVRGSVEYFRGVQLALDRLNAERPANARPLALRMPPDSQPSQIAVAAGFRDDRSVVGVVGHTGSGQTLEAAPIYADVEQGGRRALVAVTPTATNPAVTRSGEWVFRVCPTDDDAARALARYAADSIRAQRVAIVFRNDFFGRGFTRVIGPELTRRGVDVVERDPYLAGITEYAAYAQRIARSRVDAVVFAGGGPDAAEMIRALRAAGVNPGILGSDAVADIRDAGAPGEFHDVRFAAFFDAERATAAEQRAFVGDYRRRFGGVPDHQSALSYDAAMLIGRATYAVGGDRRKIRDWIARVGRGAAAHAGVTGVIRFDENGDAINKVVLIGRAAR